MPGLRSLTKYFPPLSFPFHSSLKGHMFVSFLYSFDLKKKSFARKFSYNLPHFIFYKSFCSLTWNRKLFINATVWVLYTGDVPFVALGKRKKKENFINNLDDDMRAYRTRHLAHGPFLARFLRDLQCKPAVRVKTTPYMCYLFRYHMPWVFSSPFLSFFNRLLYLFLLFRNFFKK